MLSRVLRPITLVLLGALVFFCAVSSLVIDGHRGYRTQMRDLGTAEQAVWLASQGDLAMPRSDTRDGRLRTRLAEHDFIYFLIAIPYALFPRAETLLILGVGACTAAGLGLFTFARSLLGASWWSAAVPLAYWATSIVHDAALFDFHVVTLESAFLAWSLWAFQVGRFGLGGLLVALTLSCNEEATVTVAALGLGYWLSGRRRLGVHLMVAGFVSFVGLVVLLQPLMAGGAGFIDTDGGKRYEWLGRSPMEIASKVVTEPGRVVSHLVRPDRLRLPLYFLVLGGVASLGAWRTMIAGLPMTLALLLSAAGPWTTRLSGTYYLILPYTFVVAACVVSASTDPRRRALRWNCIAACVSAALLSPLPGSRVGRLEHFRPDPTLPELLGIVADIPPDARICVQNNLGAHAARRRYVTSREGGCATAEYLLVSMRPLVGSNPGLSVRTATGYLVNVALDRAATACRSGAFDVIADRAGYLLLRRRSRAEGEPASPALIARLDHAIKLLKVEQQPSSGSRLLVGSIDWQFVRMKIRSFLNSWRPRPGDR